MTRDEVTGELVPAGLIPVAPPRLLSFKEVIAGVEEKPDGTVVEATGFLASLQRIVAGTVGIALVLAGLFAVGVGVYSLLNSLDSAGGGTQTQDLFAVGIWGLIMLLVGRPRLGKPGKRAKRKNGMALSGFVALYPALAGAFTVAGLMLTGSMASLPILAAAAISFGVCVWREVQAVAAIKSRNAAMEANNQPAEGSAGVVEVSAA